MNKPLILAFAMVSLLAACSKSEKPADPAAAAAVTEASTPAATAAPAPVVAANPVGEGVYKKVCVMCHSSGAGGAPIPGNKEQWAPRIAQGNDMLYKHALEGFTGTNGMMPARGGGATLTDDEVKAAVDYMVSQVK